MDRCEKLMTADGKNLSAVLCGENGEMSTQQNQLRSDGLALHKTEAVISNQADISRLL